MSFSIPQFIDSLKTEILASNASNLLMNQTLAAIVCSASNLVNCTAICANTDLAGVGVRVAFYLQSAMNTILVVVSPRDSVPSAWAATLLTAGLIIAAIVQKVRNTLSLHHALLVMNFATLSCISSLAVAPMLPVWRSALKPRSNAKEDQQYTPTALDRGKQHEDPPSEMDLNQQKKIEAAQNRERVILALALLTQVVLQWAWGIILFVSPVYDQPECNGDTILMLFFAPFTVKKIKGAKFAVWPMWLLFCLGVTFGLTMILSLSRPIGVQPLHLPLSIASTPKYPRKFVVFVGNVSAFSLWTLYIFASEYQRLQNRMFTGENNFGGFGQITAILLSLQPIWSLVVALYKYPSLRRRPDKYLAAQNGDQSTGRASNSPEHRRLLTFPPRHAPLHSGDLSAYITITDIELDHTGGRYENVDPDLRARGIGSSASVGSLLHARHPSQRVFWLNDVIIPTSNIGLSDGEPIPQFQQ